MKRPSRVRDDSSSEGFALVLVLGFLLLASAVIAPFAVAARTNYLIAANTRELSRLASVADVVSQLVASDIARARLELRGLGFHGVAHCRAGAATITLRVQDQSGLIDLNAAEPDMIEAGFRVLGIDMSRSTDLADAVVRNRGFRTGAGSGGRGVDVEAGWKDAPLESVAELHDLRALGRVEVERLRQAFTVHSARGTVTVDLSPPALARALTSGTTFSDRISSTSAATMPFSLEVWVRPDANPMRGYAGYILEPSATDSSTHRLEALPEDSAISDTAPASSDCPPQFGEAFHEILVLAER